MFKRLVYTLFLCFAFSFEKINIPKPISPQKFIEYEFNDINSLLDSYLNEEDDNKSIKYLTILEGKSFLAKNIEKENVFLGWIVPEIISHLNPQNKYHNNTPIYLIIARSENDSISIDRILPGILEKRREKSKPGDDTPLLINDLKEYIESLGYNKTFYNNLKTSENGRWYLEFMWNI